MIKKGTSKQNVAIIVLIVLLLLSITFGATYSYFNGSTAPINSGQVTTAILHIDLVGSSGENNDMITISQNKIVPGQPLSNTALTIYNYSEVSTYMMVIFTFTAEKTETHEKVDTTNLDVLDISDGATKEGWVKTTYTCKDGVSKIYGVVYMGSSALGVKGQGDGIISPKTAGQEYSVLEVLNADCLKAPSSWGNALQGCTLTFNFIAYAIQSEDIPYRFQEVDNEDANTRRLAIAEAIIELNGLDLTQA